MTETHPTQASDLIHLERHAALRRLAASLSHALGTPLNVISGRAELIELDAQELPDILDSAQTIRRQALKISEMLKQVLAHLDELDLEPSTQALGGLVETLARELTEARLIVDERLQASDLRRADQARIFLLQVGRWAQALQALDAVEIAPSAQPGGTEFRVHLRPGINVPDVRRALEPWIHREPCERRDGALDLSQAQQVQLAVALGHARDAGAELDLRHTLDGSLVVARWPQHL